MLERILCYLHGDFDVVTTLLPLILLLFLFLILLRRPAFSQGDLHRTRYCLHWVQEGDLLGRNPNGSMGFFMDFYLRLRRH